MNLKEMRTKIMHGKVIIYGTDRYHKNLLVFLIISSLKS